MGIKQTDYNKSGHYNQFMLCFNSLFSQT